MKIVEIYMCVFRSVLLCLIVAAVSSCGDQRTSKDDAHSIIESKYEIGGTSRFMDTLIVRSAEELIAEIKSNRLIKLEDREYKFESTLIIDNINDLKIEGSKRSELIITERNKTVVQIQNSHNVSLEGLRIGHTESPMHEEEHGALRVMKSNDIDIVNSVLLGAGTFGLVTLEVENFKFVDSEIAECSLLLFDISNSRNVDLINSKFHNSTLAISVLGGFTDSTSAVNFTNCNFLNNTPVMEGNPAFNFMDNYLDDQIVFTECSFRNNKGFQWYSDRIKLINCQVEESDFIDFPVSN